MNVTFVTRVTHVTLEVPMDDLDAMDFDGDYPARCTNPDGGHEWAYTGTQYGGEDERWGGEGRCYCVHCGADGDA